MKVEILEKEIKHGGPNGLEIFAEGEIRVVPDHVGEYFCRLGWAKDVDGNVETGERDTSRKELFVEKPAAGQKAGEAK